MTYEPVTWITVDDCLPALGVTPATPADVEFLADQVDAANNMAFDERRSAGYVDDPAVVPSPRVREGTIAYAVRQYKRRGAVDGYASFDELGGFAVTGGTISDVRAYWGVPRMGVG